MVPRFDETVRGRKFYDSQLPKLIAAIEENTEAIKKANELKEIELYEKYGYDFGGVEEDAEHGTHDTGNQEKTSE